MTATIKSNASQRLPGIDYCRGAAAMVVVFHHATGIMSMPKYYGDAPFHGQLVIGARGVDFFFVLSGFIITFSNWGTTGNIRAFRGFIAKRLQRVYPIMWCVAIPFLASSFVLRSENSPENAVGMLQSIVGSLLLVPMPIRPVPGVLWTLKHEIFFYLIFSTAFLSKRFFVIALNVWLIMCCLNAVTNVPSNFLQDFLFNAYNIEFGMGVACGWILSNRKIAFPTLVALTGAILVGLTAMFGRPIEAVAPWLTNPSSLEQIIGFGLGSSLIILGIAQCDIDQKTPKLSFAALLGAASYSIYLVHFPVMIMIIKVLMKVAPPASVPLPIAWLILCSVSTTAGIALHLFVEKPLLRWLKGKPKVAAN